MVDYACIHNLPFKSNEQMLNYFEGIRFLIRPKRQKKTKKNCLLLGDLEVSALNF